MTLPALKSDRRVIIDADRVNWQGDFFWAEALQKRRPVLVVTRSEAIPVLDWVVVAPITRTIRDIPTEIRLDQSHGLAHECVASFDNLQPIRKTFLTARIAALDVNRAQLSEALRAFADC